MSRAIISVTVLPSRLPHAEPCIESLKAQGLPLYVWIPKYVERTGNRFDDKFPGWMMDCDGAVVKDRGPIGKLLSALPLGDIILTADDDVVYGEGWAEGLLDWHSKLPDAALGYRGRVMMDRHYNHSALVAKPFKPLSVDLLTGTWGALYCADWFDDSIYDEWEQARLNDDIVINAHLKRKGIKRAVIPMDCDIRPLDGVHSINPLWDSNKYGRNDAYFEAVGWWA